MSNKANCRVRLEVEQDVDLSYLEQWNTPESYAESVMIDPKDGTEMSFEHYMETYGDPENHRVLMAIAEVQCDECEEWRVVDTLGNVTFYVGPGAEDAPLPGDIQYPEDDPKAYPLAEMDFDGALGCCEEECDDRCTVHAPDCDGHCDHSKSHANACMEAVEDKSNLEWAATAIEGELRHAEMDEETRKGLESIVVELRHLDSKS